MANTYSNLQFSVSGTTLTISALVNGAGPYTVTTPVSSLLNLPSISALEAFIASLFINILPPASVPIPPLVNILQGSSFTQ